MRGLTANIITTVMLICGSAWSADVSSKTPTAGDVRARLDARLETLRGKSGVSVMVVPVQGEVDGRMSAFVRRAVRQAKSSRPDLVLVVEDTPGGSIQYMEEIGKQLAGLEDVPTVCYIEGNAFSAGVYLAVACDRIYMKTGTTIGASTPWTMGREGLPVELTGDVKSKMYRALEALFSAMGQRKGYPSALLEGMIDPSAVVEMVEIDGKREILSRAELDNRRWQMERTLKGNAIARQEELGRRIQVVKTIVNGDGPIALTASEAQEYGLASAVVTGEEDVLENLGIESPRMVRLTPTWSEELFGWLSGPMISGVLLVVGLIALYVELKTPGFGLPGIVGITCIVLMLFSGYLVGLADYVDILIFVLGLALLLIEVFVTPGFGVLGVSGLALMAAGLFLSRQRFVLPNPANPWEIELFKWNIVAVGGALLALVVFAGLLAKFLPGIPLLNRLVLKAAAPGKPEEMVGSAGSAKEDVAVGTVGVSLSYLRPSGRARFGSKVLDVMARGEFIQSGKRIEVLETKGNRILVKAVQSEESESKA